MAKKAITTSPTNREVQYFFAEDGIVFTSERAAQAWLDRKYPEGGKKATPATEEQVEAAFLAKRQRQYGPAAQPTAPTEELKAMEKQVAALTNQLAAAQAEIAALKAAAAQPDKPNA